MSKSNQPTLPFATSAPRARHEARKGMRPTMCVQCGPNRMNVLGVRQDFDGKWYVARCCHCGAWTYELQQGYETEVAADVALRAHLRDS